MMTIAEFARLCSCNAQTLRYYDRIGLLRPAEVDRWSGYRYYAQEQAFDFIKIKNLQQADFAIDEIRSLLRQPDEAVFAAFEAKIAAQQDKLARMIQIQQTYLREKNDMDKLIQELSKAMVAEVDVQAGEAEFLLAPGEGEHVAVLAQEYMADMLAMSRPKDGEVHMKVDDEIIHGTADAIEKVQELEGGIWSHTVMLSDKDEPEEAEFREEAWEQVWQLDGWKRAGELFADMPCVEKDHEYYLRIQATHVKKQHAMTFALFMLGMMCRDKNGRGVIINCDAGDSHDGVNHFRLLRKKG